jgi:hypothetical protein
MTPAAGKSYPETVNSALFPLLAGPPALPLVRLTLALRDRAEFATAYAGRLEGDGLFVTTPRLRAAGERVRLRVELVSGGTAWSGEAVITRIGREGGRSGFWVRRAPEPAQAPPAPRPPSPQGLSRQPAVRAPSPPLPEPEQILDETSFVALWDDEAEADAPGSRRMPPPLPPARHRPARPDLSGIFCLAEEAGEEDEALLEDPLQGGLLLASAASVDEDPVNAPAGGPGADVDEEWIEGGIASLELPPEDEGFELL